MKCVMVSTLIILISGIATGQVQEDMPDQARPASEFFKSILSDDLDTFTMVHSKEALDLYELKGGVGQYFELVKTQFPKTFPNVTLADFAFAAEEYSQHATDTPSLQYGEYYAVAVTVKDVPKMVMYVEKEDGQWKVSVTPSDKKRKDGEHTCPSRPVSIEVQIAADLPSYRFFVMPNEIYIQSPYRNSRQTVDIEGERPTDPASRFILQDINFDGDLDFATWERRGGIGWGISHYWLFDRISGQFISNWLTESLKKIKHKSIQPDNSSKEIRVDYVVRSEGLVSERYMIQGDTLLLVETKERHTDQRTFVRTDTTKRLVDGVMRTVKTESEHVGRSQWP